MVGQDARQNVSKYKMHSHPYTSSAKDRFFSIEAYNIVKIIDASVNNNSTIVDAGGNREIPDIVGTYTPPFGVSNGFSFATESSDHQIAQYIF